MHFVDIWQGNLALDQEDLGKLWGLLNQQERGRAETFKLPAIHDKYVATRGLLRIILADYLGADPVSLQFITGEYGKPALYAQPLYFNLSHTADSLAIVVSDLEQIGIDIEWIKPRSSLLEIAERCFSAGEFAAWRLLSGSRQLRMFYQLWTQKEAFVKAVGRGIALGLDRCEIDLSEMRFVEVPEEYGVAQDWRIIEFFQEQDICGAVVAPDMEFELNLHRIDNLIHS